VKDTAEAQIRYEGTGAKDVILAYIRASDGSVTPKEVSEATKMPHGTAKTTMGRMKGDQLEASGGEYRLKGESGDPIYDTPAQAGDGSMDFTEEPVGYMPPSQSLSSTGRDVYWMPVIGDSMGERYKKHTLVPVAKFHDPVDDFAADDVYVIKLDGAVKIKRLQRLSGRRIRIISDNDAYPNEIIELDDGTEFEIIGRVLV
jgi:phage repressor protein C with HTH and peptisase S24 domain